MGRRQRARDDESDEFDFEGSTPAEFRMYIDDAARDFGDVLKIQFEERLKELFGDGSQRQFYDEDDFRGSRSRGAYKLYLTSHAELMEQTIDLAKFLSTLKHLQSQFQIKQFQITYGPFNSNIDREGHV